MPIEVAATMFLFSLWTRKLYWAVRNVSLTIRHGSSTTKKLLSLPVGWVTNSSRSPSLRCAVTNIRVVSTGLGPTDLHYLHWYLRCSQSQHSRIKWQPIGTNAWEKAIRLCRIKLNMVFRRHRSFPNNTSNPP